jgi:hypothetical protein
MPEEAALGRVRSPWDDVPTGPAATGGRAVLTTQDWMKLKPDEVQDLNEWSVLAVRPRDADCTGHGLGTNSDFERNGRPVYSSCIPAARPARPARPAGKI